MFSIQHYSSDRVYGWRVRVFSCFLYSNTLVTEYMAGVSECYRVFYTALLYSHRVYGWRVRVFLGFLYSITL